MSKPTLKEINADLLAALKDALAKLSAAATVLSECGEDCIRSGRSCPTTNYDGTITDAIGLSIDCENAADRAETAIKKVEAR